MTRDPQIGLSDQDLQGVPFAAFYNPQVKPPQDQVRAALTAGPLASALFPPISLARELMDDGYAPIETGYTFSPDFGSRIHCLTDMPGVTPDMWAWWFGWHGCDGRRYKLWHPLAHVDARWSDGRDDIVYLGRTSVVTEFIGASCFKATISFVDPAILGFDPKALQESGAVAICARLGEPMIPLKGGWLVHYIRPTSSGSEMRSRFWIGGETVSPSNNHGRFMKTAMMPFRPLAKVMAPKARDLLAHCGQEMNHLAQFLPDLYAEFGPNRKGKGT
ncbi:MAG: hypothetical protein AAGJ34_00035 [Pseudomonadota bacterium]